MEREFTKEQLKELERQLSCPNGEIGVEVGQIMNLNNIVMTQAAISLSKIQDGESILEIGHGNCGHLSLVLTQARNISYTGLEISKTMHEQAKLQLEDMVTSLEVGFHLYDGEKIPFEANSFDKVITVNTLYFWRNPELFLKEIERVLKPQGTFSISFADKEYMESLPFVQDRFTLYDGKKFKALVNTSSLRIKKIEENWEETINKVGEPVSRKFITATLIKKD